MKSENPSNILLNNNKSKLWQDSIYVGISLPFTLIEPMSPVRDVTDRGPTLRALPGFRLRYFGRVYSNKFIILNLFCGGGHHLVLLWGLKAFCLCNYLSIWDCLRVSTLSWYQIWLPDSARYYVRAVFLATLPRKMCLFWSAVSEQVSRAPSRRDLWPRILHDSSADPQNPHFRGNVAREIGSNITMGKIGQPNLVSTWSLDIRGKGGIKM